METGFLTGFAGNVLAPLPDGSGPSMGVAIRRFAPSDPNLHDASLQALALSGADDFRLATWWS
jgi:hypothetical protein